MELEIRYEDWLPIDEIKDKKMHLVASMPRGISPATAYMMELGIQLPEDKGSLFYDTLQNKKETVTLAPNPLTVVPIELSDKNITDCFEANEKHLKCETLFFDLESYEENDLYEIIKQAFDNYQFRHTKKVLVSWQFLKKKYTFKRLCELVCTMRWNPISVGNGYNLFIDYRDQYYIYEEHIYLRVFDENNRVYFEKRFDSYSSPENSRQARRGNRVYFIPSISSITNQNSVSEYKLHLCIDDQEGNTFKSKEYKVLFL